MSATVEQKALSLLRAFERAGKIVGSVAIEGRKIELVLLAQNEPDEFEKVDMRYDKT